MNHLTLVDAQDLAEWAKRRDAQEMLPVVIRRLIHATCDQVERAGFVSGIGIHRGGWDGIVAVGKGNAFVPMGISAWELSNSEQLKAEENYKKRTANPLGVDAAKATFVFSTLRPWPTREQWERGKASEKKWLAVRGMDADQLEQWLELAPAVHIWLSNYLRKRPRGVLSLDAMWEAWTSATNPPLGADFVLAGRAAAVTAIREWIASKESTFTLQADSRTESLAVYIAALSQLDNEVQAREMARSAIVYTRESWLDLVGAKHSLTLIPAESFTPGELVGAAIAQGHRVVQPLSRTDNTNATTHVVPPLGSEEAAKALEAVGVPE